MDERGRPRCRAASHVAARAGPGRKDRRIALARARSPACRRVIRTGSGVMVGGFVRASRHAGTRIRVSFEFFPPKTEEMERTLWDSIERLSPLRPNFVSVTYGAGGSTRERTHATVKRILDETGLTPAAHLTCVGASRNEIDGIARGYWEAGVRHIVALRGDSAEPGAPFAAHPEGYANAAELVAGLKQVAPFEISVAAYPEVHPDADCPDSDLDNLLRKIDAGADRAITQFFFSADCYFRLRDRLAARRPGIELVPGILPVTNVATTRRFAGQCGAAIPHWLDRLFEGLDNKPAARNLIAATVAS